MQNLTPNYTIIERLKDAITELKNSIDLLKEELVK